ncbi:MAG: type II secretion system protein GspG [bacterium]|nr:type II secretion system protein GspG [bacterium]
MKNSYTIVELMIVVALLGILAAIAYINFSKSIIRSRINQAKLQMLALRTALKSFYIDTYKTYLRSGSATGWPNEFHPIDCNYDTNSGEGPIDTIEEWNNYLVIGSTSPGINIPNWQGPYIQKVFIDPWNRPYVFAHHFRNEDENISVIVSYGPKGQLISNVLSNNIGTRNNNPPDRDGFSFIGPNGFSVEPTNSSEFNIVLWLETP